MARKEKTINLNPTKRHYVFELIRAVVVALIFSLLAILILSLIVTFTNVSSRAISIVNQVIKGVAILGACLLCLRLPKNSWLRGLIVGLVFVVLAFVVFSLLNGARFRFGLNILNDLAVGVVSGLLSGIIAGLIRKRK